ncbi:LOW QUALITY PROTEIN: G-protein coupled receptor 161-like [Liolophura sinensis]|uniref:LOW QUALITY PROTEIN: G-protein coupled receptor 161-like n=1 Tax=Liolophura sinensis TaxID=3198878 RepID=UPI003158F782
MVSSSGIEERATVGTPLVCAFLKGSEPASVVFIIFLASLFTNSLVFLVFYKKPALLTISNRFILNLAICNILNTIFVIPFVFVSLVAREWIFSAPWCQGIGFLTTVTFSASTLTLVVISVDRYCAVISPLHYKMRVTSQRATVMILAVWTIAVGAALPPIFGWNHFEYQAEKFTCTVLWKSRDTSDQYYTLFLTLVCFVLPLGVMVFAYAVICRAARNNSERTRRNSIIPTSTEEVSAQALPRHGRRRSSASLNLLFSRRFSTGSKGQTFFRPDEWRAAVTSLLVVSTFIVCWLPYFVIIVLESTLTNPTDIPASFQSIALFLVLSNSALNTIVYVFRSKVVRQELRAIFLLNRGISPRALAWGPSRSAGTGDSADFSTASAREAPPLLHTSSTNTTLASLVVVSEYEDLEA